MQGEDAVTASYILAYLYSSELSYHFHDKRPLMLASISYLHHQFSAPLEKLNDDEKNHFRLKNIDSEIAYANMGCKQAIENLIAWYAKNNDIAKTNEWKIRLQQLPDFLKSKYCEYYNLALQNTKKFGYVSIGEPKIDIKYFIDVWCRIQFGLEQPEKTASAFAQIKNDFIQEAESGNMITCLFLGHSALNNKNLIEAKEWFTRIVKINDASCAITPAKEAVIAARICYEIAIKEQAAFSIQTTLLEKAAQLGCVDSLLELGNMKFQSQCFDDAKKLFNLAITQSSLTQTFHQVCTYLLDNKECYPIEIIEPYYISVKGEEIKRGSIGGIEDLMLVLQKSENASLASAWSEVYQARRNGQIVNIDIIDQLIKKTLEFFAEFNSYSLDSSLSKLKLS